MGGQIERGGLNNFYLLTGVDFLQRHCSTAIRGKLHFNGYQKTIPDSQNIDFCSLRAIIAFEYPPSAGNEPAAGKGLRLYGRPFQNRPSLS